MGGFVSDTSFDVPPLTCALSDDTTVVDKTPCKLSIYISSSFPGLLNLRKPRSMAKVSKKLCATCTASDVAAEIQLSNNN